MRCGYQWWAPLARPEVVRYPDGRQVLVSTMPQVCALKPGHDGPHISDTKVIAP